ncbi:MAG: hypothetical protein ACRCTZ_00310 [Sarcina sp.]
MKKFIIEGVKVTIKRKSITDNIMSEEDALMYFDDFLNEYTDLTPETFKKISLTESEFITFVLSKYKIAEKNSFISLNNKFMNKVNTIEAYFIKILMSMGYKAIDLMNLTHEELYNTFTYEFYFKICKSEPELARALEQDLVLFGVDPTCAQLYVKNGFPIEDESNNKPVDEKEDMKNIFKSLQENN